MTIVQKIKRKETLLKRVLPKKLANSKRIVPKLLSIEPNLTGQQIMIRVRGLVTSEILNTIQKGGFKIRSMYAMRSVIFLLAEVR